MIGIEYLPQRPLPEVAEIASAAERVGVDVFSVSNHLEAHEPHLMLAAVERSTEEIALGTAVCNPYESHPVSLARQASTLAAHADRPVHLGVGAGDRSLLARLGIERSQPVRRVAETLQVVRDLLAGERVSHDGTFTVDDVAVASPPDEFQLVVGAHGPDMVAMAATYADAVVLNACHPDDVEAARSAVEAGLERRDPALGSFAVTSLANLSVDPDRTAARERAMDAAAVLVAGAPDRALDRHGIDSEAAEAVEEAIATGARDRAREHVTDAMIDAFCIAGRPTDIAARVSRLRDVTDGVVFATPLGPDPVAAVERLPEILS